MRIILTTFLILMSAFVVDVSAQVTKLYPVDEAAKEPTFFTFRARLIQAVQRRDAAYLLSILSPKIENSFGGGGGIEEFKTMWKPERAQSEVWIELATALSLGGAFGKDGAFSAPYVFAKWPEDSSIDVFGSGAIIGENVRVRAAPQITSSVMRTLSFDIVEVPDWQRNKARGEKRDWIKVKLADGQSGYVAEEFIRSGIDYRAVFEKTDGRWLMTAFIAGD
ncbi:MAG TPA: SH3 domain-containing protein [Pyrinomonadaceae bacterium]